MKGLLVGAFALVLAAASPAFAQHRPHAAPSGSHPTSHVRSHPIAHAARPQSAHHAVRTSSHRTVHHAATHATRHAAHHAARHTVRHAAHHAVHHAARQEVRHAVAAAAKGPFARVQKTVYAKRRFHAGVYRSPPGWFVHHWVLAERLPRPWFVRDYWIMDWQVYGLWAPVDGLIWVRVGNDALLIDPDTGEIIGIEYDVFW